MDVEEVGTWVGKVEVALTALARLAGIGEEATQGEVMYAQKELDDKRPWRLISSW